MVNVRITKQEIDAYKREILEQTVLLTISDAALVLRMSESTVKRRMDEGRLAKYSDQPGLKGDRILAAELREYVKNMRQENFI